MLAQHADCMLAQGGGLETGPAGCGDCLALAAVLWAAAEWASNLAAPPPPLGT
eukprot:COSAG01_NODE_5780_length_4036_cov_27.009906_8_plen_53_part_00